MKFLNIELKYLTAPKAVRLNQKARACFFEMPQLTETKNLIFLTSLFKNLCKKNLQSFVSFLPFLPKAAKTFQVSKVQVRKKNSKSCIFWRKKMFLLKILNLTRPSEQNQRHPILYFDYRKMFLIFIFFQKYPKRVTTQSLDLVQFPDSNSNLRHPWDDFSYLRDFFRTKNDLLELSSAKWN